MPNCAILFKDGSIGYANISESKLKEPLTMVRATEEELEGITDGTPYKCWGVSKPDHFTVSYFYPTKVFATISTVEEKVVHTVFIEA